MTPLGWWGVPLAVLGGAIRVSTPFLFVSLGECITERSGRINLGLEGILVMGAMTAYAVSFVTGNPWIGVLAAAGAGGALGIVHGLVCSLSRPREIALCVSLARKRHLLVNLALQLCATLHLRFRDREALHHFGVPVAERLEISRVLQEVRGL